jgi:hypothetical protein
MDPNAALADLKDLEGDLRHARANGYSAEGIAEIEDRIDECRDDLKAWRRKGGFAPRDGWPAGV